MKTYKEQMCKKLDIIYCDVCSASCMKEGAHDNEHASLSATWGYDSRKDLIHHNIDLCEDCFDKTIEFLKSQKMRLVGEENEKDPLNGEDYSIL